MATPTSIEVRILTATQEAEIICAATAKQCYSMNNAVDIIENLTVENIARILNHCIKSGHLAILASAHAAVSVNVTRESLTQINTHAWIKTVTQSQQYCAHRDFRYHIPKAFLKDEEAIKRFKQAMERDQEDYNWFLERGYESKDARAVLSNATEANTILSGNFWGWFNWLQRRVCKRNTPVTLEVAQEILRQFRHHWPIIFNKCGAPCEFGQCKEQTSCGDPYVKR